MILFLIATLFYLGTLLLIKPTPNSLKATPLTFTENFMLIRASMFSGVFILFIYLITSDFSFIAVNEYLYSLLSLSNNFERASLWPIQSVTHLFIHIDPIHLFANVTSLGVASIYERRAGSQRFISVLLVGSAASIPSIFFYSETTTVCGISGGVFGLAAAYFTDEDELTLKEWVMAIGLFVILVAMIALEGEFKNTSTTSMNVKVDHIGHLLGATGAIIYCRLRPNEYEQANAL